MKKFLILSLVVAFSFLGAQAFASPPVAPPVEGFIIESYTEIDVIGNAKESEQYSWKYFEGRGVVGATLGPCPDCPNREPNAILAIGFQEGAEIAYQQDFTAVDGSTHFEKTFKAVSHTDSTTPNNLTVDKDITYEQTAGGSGYATHLEKVGLSIVSAGDRGGDPIERGDNLLTLCPWATGSDGVTAGYPPTNEGIAAASEFKVTKITFSSASVVNSTDNPFLSYEVVDAVGEGRIAAGFVVELWEGREGDIWGSVASTRNGCANCYVPEGPPDLASRTTYKEHAEADGVWTFTKKVSYESVMPTGTPASTFPINNVP